MAAYKNTIKGFAKLAEEVRDGETPKGRQIIFKRFLLALDSDLNGFENIIPKSESGPFESIYDETLDFVRQMKADNKVIESQNMDIIERFRSESLINGPQFAVFYRTLDQEGKIERFKVLVDRQIIKLNPKQLQSYRDSKSVVYDDDQLRIRKKFLNSIGSPESFDAFLKGLGSDTGLYIEMVKSKLIVVPKNLLSLSFAFSKQFRDVVTVTPKQKEAPQVLRKSKEDMSEVLSIYFQVAQQYLHAQQRFSIGHKTKMAAELPKIIVTHRTLLFARLQDRGLFPLYVEMVKCGNLCVPAEFLP